jgi:integrase
MEAEMSNKWLKTPEELGPHLYLKHNGKFFYSFTINGEKRQRRALDAITKAFAHKEGRKKQADHDAFRNGLTASDPFAEKAVVTLITVGSLYAKWEGCGYPSFGKLTPLTTDQREQYISTISKAIEFFKDYEVEKLGPKDLIDFFQWRTAGCKAGVNHRATDTALAKLSSLLSWARELEFIEVNPILQKRKFQDSDDVKHCTEFMPQSDEELHELCGWFIKKERKKFCPMPAHRARQVIGWRLLFEAYTGCRTSEITGLRFDAKEGEPGHVNWPLRYLSITRAKAGKFPYVVLDQVEGNTALVDLIAAHRAWHREAYGGQTQWYFPDRSLAQIHPKSSHISTALQEACKALGLPRRTSHGMRAFYVATLRSLGLDDTEVAIRLGHRSGVQLVEATYGEAKPNWRGSKLQDWLPEPIEGLAYQSHAQSHAACVSAQA